MLAFPALFLLDQVDDRPDALLGQDPALVGQAADQFELEPHVDILGPVIISQHVGSQGQGQLGRAAAGVIPLEPGRRMAAKVVARVKAAALAVLFDDDRGAVFRARAVVDLHAPMSRWLDRDGKAIARHGGPVQGAAGRCGGADGLSAYPGSAVGSAYHSPDIRSSHG